MARQRYGFDEAKIARFLKEGRGRGAGRDYQPWLTIGDVPSSGRSHRPRGIKTGRVHHLLSDIENGLFLILDWCDAVKDIREQFPLDRAITQRIADRLGIDHPKDVRTRTPLVMTTDFLVDVVRDGRIQQYARAVKPADELDKPRILAKLAIEQVYWGEQDIDWGIVTNQDIPPFIVRNIAWVHQYAKLDGLTQPYEGFVEEKARLLELELPNSPRCRLGQFCDDMALRLTMEPGKAMQLFRHLLARKSIICPMDRIALDGDAPLEIFESITQDHDLLLRRREASS